MDNKCLQKLEKNFQRKFSIPKVLGYDNKPTKLANKSKHSKNNMLICKSKMKK